MERIHQVAFSVAIISMLPLLGARQYDLASRRVTPISSAANTFTHVTGQGVSCSFAGSGTTTYSCALPNNPALGDVVTASFCTFNNNLTTVPGIVAIDSNLNSYVISPNSPVGGLVGGTSSGGFCFDFYLLNAPSNASKTVNITLTLISGGFGAFFLDEFSVSPGPAVFDGDIPGTSSTAAAVCIVPTVPITGTKDLLYASVTTTNRTTGAGSPWTGNAGGVASNSWFAEYEANATTGTAVNFTLTTFPTACASIGMAFK